MSYSQAINTDFLKTYQELQPSYEWSPVYHGIWPLQQQQEMPSLFVDSINK